MPEKLRLSHIVAGLLASGTAGDLRRLRAGFYRSRNARQSPKSKAQRSAPLRIVAHLPTYAPLAHGGAQSSMRATLGFMRECGYEATVITDHGPRGQYQLDDVEVMVRPDRRKKRDQYASASIVFSQSLSAPHSYLLATAFDKPFVLFIRDIGDWRRLPGPAELVVFNAEWQRHAFEYKGNSVVVHPPIDPHKYLTAPGRRVTLINLNSRKGGELFGKLVPRMPDIDFLGVVGMWGQQLVPAVIPPNLEILASQADVRQIYSKTRILLVPSKWESFGRVAVEAGLSGIPVVASPNPGTFEALGNAAIYANPSDLDQWVDAVRSLDDPAIYSAWSEAVATAAHRYSMRDELNQLEAALRALVL